MLVHRNEGRGHEHGWDVDCNERQPHLGRSGLWVPRCRAQRSPQHSPARAPRSSVAGAPLALGDVDHAATYSSDDEARQEARPAPTEGVDARADEPTYADDDAAFGAVMDAFAEAATKVISRAHVRAGARQGHDVRLTAAEKRLQPLLGPAAMEALRADLVAHIDWCGGDAGDA